MATKPAAPPRPTQPPLIPLTAEEMREAPRKLATLIDDLEELDKEHKKARADQAKTRKKVRGRILSLASQIRNQGR